MIRASTIGHQEIQQAVAFTSGHVVARTEPDWAATVAGGKSGARQKAQKQLRTAGPAVEEEGKQRESNLRKKGLHDRNSPMCTLSQNGYGARRSELNCAEEIVFAALEAPADDTMIRASAIGHQEIQQAVAFSTGHAVLKPGPDWAATVAAAKSGARQKAQK